MKVKKSNQIFTTKRGKYDKCECQGKILHPAGKKRKQITNPSERLEGRIVTRKK